MHILFPLYHCICGYHLTLVRNAFIIYKERQCTTTFVSLFGHAAGLLED